MTDSSTSSAGGRRRNPDADPFAGTEDSAASWEPRARAGLATGRAARVLWAALGAWLVLGGVLITVAVR